MHLTNLRTISITKVHNYSKIMPYLTYTMIDGIMFYMTALLYALYLFVCLFNKGVRVPMYLKQHQMVVVQCYDFSE